MDKQESIQQRIEAIAKMDEKEIDALLEDWLIININKKLEEKLKGGK